MTLSLQRVRYLILVTLVIGLCRTGPVAQCFTIQRTLQTAALIERPKTVSRSPKWKLTAKEVHTYSDNPSSLVVNGESDWFEKVEEELLPEALPLSYDKYLTMKNKRVHVTIRYSSGSGLKPYFLTVAKKLKMSHPDVVLERVILPPIADGDANEATFEVLVDKKTVLGNGRNRKQKAGNVDMSHGQSIFVSMHELDLAISRARRRRRPTTRYGDLYRTARLDSLRRSQSEASEAAE